MRETADQGRRANARYEEKANLLQFLDRRIVAVHRGGPKVQPVEKRKLSRNARRLLKRILVATTEDDPIWLEVNEDTARALKINRSTVVRLTKRLCQVGVLQPVDTKGGRGRPSQYHVHREKAQALLRHGYWGAGEEFAPSKQAQKEPQEHTPPRKPAQEFRPASSHLPSEGISCQGGTVYALPPKTPLFLTGLNRDPLEWLTKETKVAVKKIADAFRDPFARKLIGHGALFTGICTLGPWAIWKTWLTKGKTPALALFVVIALMGYQSWKLIESDLDSLEVERDRNGLLSSRFGISQPRY